MLPSGIAMVALGVANLALYRWLIGELGSESVPPMDAGEYATAKERVRAVSPWSPEGRRLRAQIRETDRPGAASRTRCLFVAISSGFVAAGVILCGLAIVG